MTSTRSAGRSGSTKSQLWAISYGTHLALATLRRHPESDRARRAGGRRGGRTTRSSSPPSQQALMERIAAIHAAEHPDAPPFLDDVQSPSSTGSASRTRRGRRRDPGRDGPARRHGLRRPGPRREHAGRPGDLDAAPGDVRRHADRRLLGRRAPWIVWTKGPRGVDAMSAAMDAASGASLWRRARIAAEARTRRSWATPSTSPPRPRPPRSASPTSARPSARPSSPTCPSSLISGTLDGPNAALERRRGRAPGSRTAPTSSIQGGGPLGPALPRLAASFSTGCGRSSAGEPVADETLGLSSGETSKPPAMTTRWDGRPHGLPSRSCLATTASTPPPSPSRRRGPSGSPSSQGAQRQPYGTLTETVSANAGRRRRPRPAHRLAPRGPRWTAWSRRPTSAPPLPRLPEPRAHRPPPLHAGRRHRDLRRRRGRPHRHRRPRLRPRLRRGPRRPRRPRGPARRRVRGPSPGPTSARRPTRPRRPCATRSASRAGRPSTGATPPSWRSRRTGGPTTRSWVDVETRAVLRLESEVAPGVTFLVEPS